MLSSRGRGLVLQAPRPPQQKKPAQGAREVRPPRPQRPRACRVGGPPESLPQPGLLPAQRMAGLALRSVTAAVCAQASGRWVSPAPPSPPRDFGESGQAWPPCPITPWFCIPAKEPLLGTANLGSRECRLLGCTGRLPSIFRNTKENSRLRLRLQIRPCLDSILFGLKKTCPFWEDRSAR